MCYNGYRNNKGGEIMEFKQLLLNFRANHNLTQKDLSKIFGVTLNTIHRYESGSSNPSAMHEIQFKDKLKKWEENENENVQMQ